MNAVPALRLLSLPVPAERADRIHHDDITKADRIHHDDITRRDDGISAAEFIDTRSPNYIPNPYPSIARRHHQSDAPSYDGGSDDHPRVSVPNADGFRLLHLSLPRGPVVPSNS